jgi:hypothetical protein
LRPGDIIVFNPHIHYCLSEKGAAYNERDVHVITFYVQTAHVGKNDNNLPLTKEENYFYDMPFFAGLQAKKGDDYLIRK